jgi:hypothetical protein
MEQPETYSAVAVSHPDEHDLSRLAGRWDTHLEVTISQLTVQTSGPAQEVSAWEAAWQGHETLEISTGNPPATVTVTAGISDR